MPKLFITHAEADRPLVVALVGMLTRGTRVPAQDIYSSSVEGHGVRPGTNPQDAALEALEDTVLAIALVSEEYWISPYCQWELGAIWLKNCSVFPLLIAPMDVGDLKGPLDSRRSEHIDDVSGLSRLFDAVNRAFGFSDVATDAWEQARSRFLDELDNSLSARRASGRMLAKRRTERMARVATSMESYHQVLHHLRDAAFVTFIYGASRDHFYSYYDHLQMAVDHLQDVFTDISGYPCRICVKQTMPFRVFEDGERSSGPPIVFDLVRSRADNVYDLDNFDLIQANTDFEYLMEQKGQTFHSNDLKSLFEAGSYSNSHWVDGIPDPPPYLSTIVWPIRKLLYPPDSKLLTPLLGFLCVDSAQTGAFEIDQDLGIGAGIADTFYHVLQPWIGDPNQMRDSLRGDNGRQE